MIRLYIRRGFGFLGGLTLIGTFLLGCVTPSNEPDFKKVKPKQRLYLGNVDVILNGQKNPKCELYINGDLMPHLKVSSDGYVIIRTDRKKAGLSQITCLHEYSKYKVAWHTQDLDLKKFLRPKNSQTAHYFGHLKLDWKIDPERTRLAKTVEKSGPLQELGFVKNSGEISIEVEDRRPDLDSYLQSHWSVLKDREVLTALAEVQGSDSDEDED